MSKKPIWKLAWYRAVGEFKDGERKMIEIERFKTITYRTEKQALKGVCRTYREPYKAFVFRMRKPKRVTEIQINYSAE